MFHRAVVTVLLCLVAVPCFGSGITSAVQAAPAGGSISYVDGAGNTFTNTSTPTVSVPAHNAGDMIVSWIGADDFSSSRSQLDASGGSLTWNHLALQSASHISGRFAWAVGTSGTASGFTLTWTIDAAESGAIVVAIFRDENASPIGVNNTNSGSGLTITITQTTGVTSGSYALVCVAWDAQDIKTNDGYPSNSTGIYSDHSTDGSAAAGAGCAYDTTATSSEAYQFTGNAPDQNLGMVIEIKD